MFHVFHLRKPLPLTFESNVVTQRVPILLFFLIGVLTGAVIGSYADPGAIHIPLLTLTTDYPVAESFLTAFIRPLSYLLILFACGASLYGVFALPLVSFSRAFSLSCSIAVVCRETEPRGMFAAFFAIALPSLLSIPCFLILANDAAFLSRHLLSLVSGRSIQPPPAGPRILRHAFLAFVCAALESLYCSLLLPRIFDAIL